MCQIIQVNTTTLQFVKLINSEYEKIVEIGLKSAGREYIKLFFIQFILGNFSKESIIQTIDEYKLPPIPKEIEDFFFVYNYQMCDFEKLIEIKPRYLNEISKIKIYPTSQVSIERNELGRGGNGTVHSGVLKEIDCQGNEISIPVAIKIPTQFNKSKLIEVYKELAIHQKINGICGPKLFGCVKLNVGFGIIIERFDCESRSIAYKYREGKVKRTLKKGLKVFDTVYVEAFTWTPINDVGLALILRWPK
ncbi:hypothetical protein ACTFIR_009972 [Dictyostelium discoideum]